jgi:hypothetical protein
MIIRQIAEQHGSLDSCDAFSGKPTAQLENHLIGCRSVNGPNPGADCASPGIIDALRPAYAVDGATSTFSAVRVPTGASCDAIVAAAN